MVYGCLVLGREVILLQTGREGVVDLLGLGAVIHLEGVQVLGQTKLELDGVVGLLDLDDCVCAME